MRPNRPTRLARRSEQIRAETEAYLTSGGEIHHAPPEENQLAPRDHATQARKQKWKETGK